MSTMRTLLAYLMIAGGLVILLLGARDFFESRLGQSNLAHDFETPGRQTNPPVAAASSAPSAPSRQAPSAQQAPPVKPDRTVPESSLQSTAIRTIQRGDPFAKMIIPRLHSQLYVVEGDHTAELRRGPGHLVGTAMPGGRGNCVIAGHRDTHFRILRDIRKDDLIILETHSGRYTYRVQLITVISPNNLSPLQHSSDAELHLITCYPFSYVGSAPKRFVVQADLVNENRGTAATVVKTSSFAAPEIAHPATIAPRHAAVGSASARKPARTELPARSTAKASARRKKAAETARVGHRKMGGWNRVPKSSIASRSYHPTSLP